MDPASTSTAVTVAVCDGRHQVDVDVAEVRSLVAARDPDLHLEVVPALCRALDRLPEGVGTGGGRRVVLGLCEGAPSDEAQAWARRTGLDPFEVEIVDLGLVARLGPAAGSARRAAAVLAGAVAAARASRSGDGGAVRLRLSEGNVSRRTLLSRGPLAYRPLAAIDPRACLGTARCGLCVASCPVDAIRMGAPTPSVASSCEACGACVTTCPVGAIGLHGASVPQMEARLGSALSDSESLRPSILFACRAAATQLQRNGDSPRRDWIPVPVPCLSIVTPGWALQVLAMGAPAVALLGCGPSCRVRGADRTRARVSFLEDVLCEVGGSEPRVANVTTDEPLAPPLDRLSGEPVAGALVAPAAPTLAEPAATSNALLRLAEAPIDVPNPSSPLGIVTVDADGCTLCGLCADACPLSALALERAEDSASLSFDGARCVACQRCVDACPEHVVAVEARTDLVSAGAGRRELKAGVVAACARCGRPIAPSAMLERIRTLLADESPELVAVTTSLCSSCRGLGGPAATRGAGTA